MLLGEHGGDPMMAHIAMMRACTGISRKRHLYRDGRVSKPTGLFDEQNCEHDAANRASTNLPIFAKDTAR